MKKRNLFIIILVIFLGVLIFFLTRKREINTFEFPDTLVVENYTDNWLADTLSMVILNKIMGYDTINLKIYNKPAHINHSDYEIIGFVERNFFDTNSYILYINNNLRFNELKRFISHEMIHIDQLQRGDLITFFSNYEYTIYKDDTIYFMKVPYKKRPFEVDAYKREREILKKLNNLLYK